MTIRIRCGPSVFVNAVTASYGAARALVGGTAGCYGLCEGLAADYPLWRDSSMCQ